MTTDADAPFVVNKVWEYPDKTVALQIFSQRSGSSAKSFLVININQIGCGMRLQSTKPQGLPKQGTLSALIRKYLIRSRITGIWCDGVSSDLWMVLQQPSDSSSTWYIYLARSMKPPLLSLIGPEGMSLARMSSSATYTKAHPHSTPLPDFKDGRFTPVDLGTGDEQVPTGRITVPSEEQPGVANDQKIVRDRLKRKLKTLKNSAKKTFEQIPKTNDIEILERKAHLLKEFLHLADSGEAAMVVSADLTGLGYDSTVELDENLSPSQNLQIYFTRLKKSRTAAEIQGKMLEKLKVEIASLEKDIERLTLQTLSPNELDELRARYKLLKQPPPPDTRAVKSQRFGVLPYRHFDVPGIAKILVGKAAAESDAMLKKAKSNDYWLHVVSGTGTHVLILHKSMNPAESEKAQRIGAILAIHYSQHRNTKAAEVYLSQRGNIKKQKGMADGLWKIDRAKTIMVQYEEEELTAILAHRIA